MVRDLRHDDLVLGGDGEPCRVLAILPKPRQIVYRIELDDGGSLVTDGGHYWKHRTPSMRRMGLDSWVVDSTRSLSKWSGNLGDRASIPIAPSLALPAERVPIDPYLLGRHLAGDECLNRHQLNQLSYLVRGDWVPELYRHNGNGARCDVLRGVCDMLGRLSPTGRTVVVPLRDPSHAVELAYLARSVGMLAFVRGRESNWRVLIRSARRPPFQDQAMVGAWRPYVRQEREVTSVRVCGEGMVTCISVSSADHTFLAGQDLIVTHNASTAWDVVSEGHHRLGSAG